MVSFNEFNDNNDHYDTPQLRKDNSMFYSNFYKIIFRHKHIFC